jgi:hypothetical protein
MKQKIESLKFTTSRGCIAVVFDLLQCDLTKKDYETITNYLMLRFKKFDNHLKKILNKTLETGLEEKEYEFIKIEIALNQRLYDIDSEIKLFELYFFVDFIKAKNYENVKKELLEIYKSYHYTHRISEDDYEEVDGLTYITDFYYKEILDNAIEIKHAIRTAAEKMQSNIEVYRSLKKSI